MNPTLVYFGQISYRKGIWDLLFAIKNLTMKFPDILLNIGGFGNESFINEVEHYIHKNKLENNIKILGYVSTEKQIEYYNSCDAVITASYWEGFGLPIIEAYACNKPIFVRNTTAMKELVNDERFKFDNLEEMVNKIDYFFSNRSEFDLDYRKILNFDDMDWDYSADQYLKIFK
jgi:glycosyltransferase involved in cell wall biosynthesis